MQCNTKQEYYHITTNKIFPLPTLSRQNSKFLLAIDLSNPSHSTLHLSPNTLIHFDLNGHSPILIYCLVTSSLMFDNYHRELSSSTFNPMEVAHFLQGGQENYLHTQKTLSLFSDVRWDPNEFNEGRIHGMKESIRQVPNLVRHVDIEDPETAGAMSMIKQYQSPGSIHLHMFIICIKLMGTQAQQKEFLDKCGKYDIVGCYAQTELGHGSDVQSLQTTATLDEEKDEFVINTPTIEAAKWWPGDLGCYANWALVHAKLIIRDKDYGIQNFLVPIRDEDMNLLPGVEAGDIGPKFGFLAKDNGFMFLRNVRIPRKNMLRKYVKIENGVLTKRGNEKVGYATMMLVRRLLSGYGTRIYANGLTIAGKYSFARKQFRDDKKEEIAVIEYQLQQNKILSCMAEHFAIQIGSRKTSQMTMQNIEKVNNNDDSMMKETHNCLCLAKALYTDYCNRGLEILRLACGGHGFSHYSGMPHIIQQFSPNVTLEGENTVLYLQVARYLMKAYGNSISKKKPLGDSVGYISKLEELLEQRVKVEDWKGWDVQHLHTLLAQTTLSLISGCTERLMSDESSKRAWDFKAGLKLQQLAHSHAVYWTYNSFMKDLLEFKGSEEARKVINDLCLLYGINSVLSKPQPLIEGGLVQPLQLSSLQQKKENLLKSLRGHLPSLISSMGLPDYYERSALTYGNVYKNMFSLAKSNPINQQMSPSIDILKRGLTNTRPSM